MPALAHLDRWRFAAALGAASAAFGVVAGINPRFAIAAALSFAFLLLVLADLYVGLILFTLLNFAAQVPTVAGPGLSFAKIAGLLLAISWVAALATRQDTRSDFTSAHPGLTYVLVLFLSWVALSQLWAEDSGQALTEFSRLALNALLFLIIFTAVRTPTQAIGFVAAFVGGACIDGLYGMLFATSNPGTASRLSSSITNPNELATILVAALVLSLGLAAALRQQPLARWAALAAAALCIGGIFLTGSRGGLVALAVALAAFLVVGARWRGRMLVVVVAVALAGFGYFNYVASPAIRSHVSSVGSGTGRLDLWTVAWRMVEQEPIQGVGAGNFPVVIGALPAAAGSHRTKRLHRWVTQGRPQHLPRVVGGARSRRADPVPIRGGFCLYSALKAAGSFARQGDDRMEVIARTTLRCLGRPPRSRLLRIEADQQGDLAVTRTRTRAAGYCALPRGPTGSA